MGEASVITAAVIKAATINGKTLVQEKGIKVMEDKHSTNLEFSLGLLETADEEGLAKSKDGRAVAVAEVEVISSRAKHLIHSREEAAAAAVVERNLSIMPTIKIVAPPSDRSHHKEVGAVLISSRAKHLIHSREEEEAAAAVVVIILLGGILVLYLQIAALTAAQKDIIMQVDMLMPAVIQLVDGKVANKLRYHLTLSE